jgi:ferrochelatase
MTNRPVGVLVMSYGTPKSMDRIEAYYTHIRRGRPPTPEQLAELTARYAAIGGVFPLREHTDRQAAALEARLERDHPGACRIYQGLKHAEPFIEDGVKAMAADGVREAVGIVLAPHYSVMSVGSYIARAREAAEAEGIRMAFVESYHLHPKLIEAIAIRLREALARFGGPEEQRRVKVLFSAHSLPERILSMGDPYVDQLMATSRAAAEAAGVADWEFTWQSAGRTNEPWLGPDILETLDRLAGEGVKAVLSAPIGFVSDHLEVLYDLDIEAKQFAAERGIRFERIGMLNDDPLYIGALAELVTKAAAGLAAGKRG